MFNRPKLVYLLLGALLLGVLVLAGCSGGQTSYTLASRSVLTDDILSAPMRTQQAYQFAVANPDLLTHQPCYCGCNYIGHENNLECYVQAMDRDRNITFDTHAVGCSVCVDITQDVMRLMREGKTQLEIRQYIDATYSPYGPSTDTPLPEA